MTVNESSSASFQCNASGDPKPVVIWFNRGMQLSGGGRFVIYENSLTILHTVASDAGEYSCNVSNGLDSHVGVAHLLVQGKMLCFLSGGYSNVTVFRSWSRILPFMRNV